MSLTKLSSALLTGVAVVALVACGNEAPTADAPHQVRAALNDVDSAILAEDYPDASDALKELKRLVIEAQRAGTLSDEQAREILSAADRLSGSLAAQQSQEEDVFSPTPVVTESQPDGDEGNQKEEDAKPKDAKPEEDKGKPAKSGGPGNSEDAPGHDDD